MEATWLHNTELENTMTWKLLSAYYDYNSACWNSYDVAHSALSWVKSKLGPKISDKLDLQIEASGANEYRIHSATIGGGDGYFAPSRGSLVDWLQECNRLRQTVAS